MKRCLRIAPEYIGLDHPSTMHGRERVDVWGDAHDLPFHNSTLDAVCSFHVLEHCAFPQTVLTEAQRVLRLGGAILLLVPFMWGVHESPRDYYRSAPYGLEHLLREAGLANIVVEPLCGYCATASLRLSYALQLYGRGPLRVPILLFSVAIQGVGLVMDRLDPTYNDAAGYVVAARRPNA